MFTVRTEEIFKKNSVQEIKTNYTFDYLNRSREMDILALRTNPLQLTDLGDENE